MSNPSKTPEEEIYIENTCMHCHSENGCKNKSHYIGPLKDKPEADTLEERFKERFDILPFKMFNILSFIQQEIGKAKQEERERAVGIVEGYLIETYHPRRDLIIKQINSERTN